MDRSIRVLTILIHRLIITLGITLSRNLVALDTSIRLSILAKTIVLSGLVVAAIAAGSSETATASIARSLAALLTSLVRVDLAMGELAGANALVGLAVLAETVVL